MWFWWAWRFLRALEYDRAHPGNEGAFWVLFAVYPFMMLSSGIVFAVTRRATDTGTGPGASSRANAKGCLTLLAWLLVVFVVFPAAGFLLSGNYLLAVFGLPLLWLAVMVWCPIALYRSSRS